MLLVYLDHSDLADISDGKARHLDLLSDALTECAAGLLVSTAHLLDMAKADDATKARWHHAVCSLAPVRFAIQPGTGEAVTGSELADCMELGEAEIRAVTAVLTLQLDAQRAQREANLAAPPPCSPAQLRESVSSILEGDWSALRGLPEEDTSNLRAILESLPLLASELGIERDAFLDSLEPDPHGAIARGDLDEAVRTLRRRDHRRKPRFSDHADEMHLQFARHADVATVDANVHQSLQPAFGRPITIDSRGQGRERTKLIILKSGHLDEVARAVRRLGADVARSTEVP